MFTADVLSAIAKKSARLVTTDEDEVQVAHEALIRHWATLRAWLDDDREGHRIQRRLTEAANHLEGQPGGFPLPGPEDGVSALAFSPDGKWLASAGGDNTLCLWTLPTAILLDKVCTLGGATLS